MKTIRSFASYGLFLRIPRYSISPQYHLPELRGRPQYDDSDLEGGLKTGK